VKITAKFVEFILLTSASLATRFSRNSRICKHSLLMNGNSAVLALTSCSCVSGEPLEAREMSMSAVWKAGGKMGGELARAVLRACATRRESSKSFRCSVLDSI